MEKIVECVPNFSEGHDRRKIRSIAQAIKKVVGVKLFDIASDKNHNRTVITFVGEPESVRQAAFNAIDKAQDLIDMSRHKGEHPRLGACDVCPFVPIKNVSMEDCVGLAKHLGREVGDKLLIPVYLYAEAAKIPERKNLADIRRGEYEGLEEKIKDPRWRPDFGPILFHEKSGATIIGARPFLIAYNVNLKTAEKGTADKIARLIRESGWQGKPGFFKTVKAMGVFLADKGIAQVSMNLTDYKITSMRVVFEMIKALAILDGIEILGSEIVGLVSKEALIEAGMFYEPIETSEKKLIESAVKNLKLDYSGEFIPKRKIIDYMLEIK